MSGRLTGTKRFNRKFRIRTLSGSYQILHKSCRLEHRHRPRSNGTYSHAKQSNHANHSSSTNNSLQSNSKNSRPPHWPGFNWATIQLKKWDSNETENGGTDAQSMGDFASSIYIRTIRWERIYIYACQVFFDSWTPV